MFFKIVDFFFSQELVNCLMVSLKIVIEGIKFLVVPSAKEKFSVVPTNFIGLLLKKKLNEG